MKITFFIFVTLLTLASRVCGAPPIVLEHKPGTFTNEDLERLNALELPVEQVSPAILELYPKVDPIGQYHLLWYFTGRETLPVSVENFLAAQLLPHSTALVDNDWFWFGSRPNLSAIAARALSVETRVQSPEALAKLTEFANTPIKGGVPNNLRDQQYVGQVEHPGRRAGMRKAADAMSLSLARNWAIRSVAKNLVPERGREFLMSHRNDSNRDIREQSMQALVLDGILTDDLVGAVVDLPFNNPGRQIEYAHHLLKDAKEHREKTPAAETIVVRLLNHPNEFVRSAAIDLLRSWGTLTHPAAVEELNELRPRLKGYSFNAATEILINQGKLPPSAKVPFPAVSRVSANPVPTPVRLRPEELVNHPTYMRLFGDLFLEAETFEMDAAEKERIRNFREKLWTETSPDRYQTVTAFPWGSLEPPKSVSTASLTPSTSDVRDMHVGTRQVDPAYLHSMPDFEEYLTARMGPEVIRMAIEGEIHIEVFGGTAESLLRHRKVDVSQMKRIPSPYAQWGIEKYLDLSVKPPTLVFLVPPNEQLVQHYDAMIHNLGVKDYHVYISEGDRKVHEANLKSAAGDLVRQAPHPIDGFIMGYDYAWLDAIKNRPEWRIHELKKLEADCAGCGIHGTYVEITHESRPNVPRRMLIVGSSRTLWGESSLHLVKGLVEANGTATQDVLFFGSAGSPGTKIQYGVSIPSYFIDHQGEYITLRNAVNHGSMSVDAQFGEAVFTGGKWVEGMRFREKRALLPPILSVDQVDHSTHGFSSSPADQTRHVISVDYLDRKVHTVDVETNLIARYVHEWNEANPEFYINFGTGHVITDNPASDTHTRDSNHSLSTVNREKKALARDRLLDIVFESFKQRVYGATPFGECVQGLSAIFTPESVWRYHRPGYPRGNEREPIRTGPVTISIGSNPP